jgi:hypothetical protein
MMINQIQGIPKGLEYICLLQLNLMLSLQEKAAAVANKSLCCGMHLSDIAYF